MENKNQDKHWRLSGAKWSGQPTTSSAGFGHSRKDWKTLQWVFRQARRWPWKHDSHVNVNDLLASTRWHFISVQLHKCDIFEVILCQDKGSVLFQVLKTHELLWICVCSFTQCLLRLHPLLGTVAGDWSEQLRQILLSWHLPPCLCHICQWIQSP